MITTKEEIRDLSEDVLKEIEGLVQMRVEELVITKFTESDNGFFAECHNVYQEVLTNLRKTL